MSDQTKSLAGALALLQTKLPRITKSERAEVATKQGSYSYTYAGLADISAQILPLLGEIGLSFTAKPTFVDDRFVLAYSLLHVSGEREDGEYPLPTSGTPQAVGSAITYGRRYCLCAVTGVAPEEDDDGAAAEAEAAATRSTAQRRPRPTRQPAAASQPSAQRTTRPQSEPPLPGDQPDNTSTEAQQRKIAVLMREQGIDDRDHARERVTQIIGRRVESRGELTVAEASRVIEALRDGQANGGAVRDG